MSQAFLTPHDERRVAVAAGVDPRTVRAYLRGEPTRSTTASRITEALRSLDLRTVPSTETAVPVTSD